MASRQPVERVTMTRNQETPKVSRIASPISTNLSRLPSRLVRESVTLPVTELCVTPTKEHGWYVTHYLAPPTFSGRVVLEMLRAMRHDGGEAA